MLVRVAQRVGESRAERDQIRIVTTKRRCRVVRIGRRRRVEVAEHSREVDVEQRVERRPVGVSFDERGGVGVAHLVAGQQVDHVECAGGVDVLGDRHRQAGVAQRDDELVVPVDEAHSVTAGRSSSFVARV